MIVGQAALSKCMGSTPCANPHPVRDATEGGGEGLGYSGVYDCTRPPFSRARRDVDEASRAKDNGLGQGAQGVRRGHAS